MKNVSVAVLAIFLSLSPMASGAHAGMSDVANRANEIVAQPLILAGRAASAVVLGCLGLLTIFPGAPVACVAGAIADASTEGCTKGANAAGNALVAQTSEGLDILSYGRFSQQNAPESAR